MAKLKDLDIMEINKWFEEALNRFYMVYRKTKISMLKKFRDEVYFLLTWEKPTPSMIMNRWEDRIGDFSKSCRTG